mgnify:CR=1 FL=1
MMELKLSSILGAGILACCVSSTSHASLIDGGNGLVYDTVLDITWLTDANLALSNTFGVTGMDVDGYMTWDTGMDWISAMNTANYMGYSDWRMPTVTPVNGVNFQYIVSYDASTDKGFNNDTTANELSHLFYSTLGNTGQCSEASTPETGCIYNTGFGLSNTGPFENMSSFRYWTNVTREDASWRAFDFSMGGGQTGTGAKDGAKQVWAVLDGDVAGLMPVPVPAAAWLFGSGLIGLLTIARRSSNNK